MPYFTYDTSVLISQQLTSLQRMPNDFRLSAVVLMELTAGSDDRSQRKSLERIFRQYRDNDLLIVPNADDWLLASKILFLLSHERRGQKKESFSAYHPEFLSVSLWMF